MKNYSSFGRYLRPIAQFYFLKVALNTLCFLTQQEWLVHQPLLNPSGTLKRVFTNFLKQKKDRAEIHKDATLGIFCLLPFMTGTEHFGVIFSLKECDS